MEYYCDSNLYIWNANVLLYINFSVIMVSVLVRSNRIGVGAGSYGGTKIEREKGGGIGWQKQTPAVSKVIDVAATKWTWVITSFF